MNIFVENAIIESNLTLTENMAVTHKSSLNDCVDLFFQVGALRGNESVFLRSVEKAYAEDEELTIRILLWARDREKGAGERQTFRSFLRFLEIKDPERAKEVIPFVPFFGRWDDLLYSFETEDLKSVAYDLYTEALQNGNGLAAKWAPREKANTYKKHKVAKELIRHMGINNKQYRKMLSELTNVVENAMCSKKWDSIKYDKIPSLAFSRYRNAFQKHSPDKFKEFIEDVKEGKKEVKAGVLYPYDILKTTIGNSWYNAQAESKVQEDAIIEQWKALPNYLTEGNFILPMIDVSGSMFVGFQNSNIRPIHISVSLGLYLADKQEGAFKDLILTFTETPEFVHLKGKNILQKYKCLDFCNWGMNTNVNAAFKKIIDHAINNSVPQSEMPKYLLIISDMEFDSCGGRTNYQTAKNEFLEAGYEPPNVIFWNVQSRSGNNFPVTQHESGTALISGFSPAIMKQVLRAEKITPADIMFQTIMQPRYNIWNQEKEAA